MAHSVILLYGDSGDLLAQYASAEEWSTEAHGTLINLDLGASYKRPPAANPGGNGRNKPKTSGWSKNRDEATKYRNDHQANERAP